MTSSGRREPQSRIEERFNFIDPDFHRYINALDITPDALLRHHDNMVDGEHPIVRYAAGWAAAEYARSPQLEDRPVSLEKRLGALQMARECWVATDLASFGKAQKTEELQMEAKGLEVRLLQALASTPTTEIVASWFAGEPLERAAIAAKLRSAHLRTLSVGEAVNSMPKATDEQRKMRAGLASENACLLVGQSRTGEDYILLPSSLRQDNNADRDQRADTLAIMNDPGHRLKLLQVRTNPEHEMPAWALDVYAHRDLVAPATRSVYGTITSFALQERGMAIPRVSKDLDMLSQILAARINEFQHSFTRV